MSRLSTRLRYAAAREQRCPSLQIEAAEEIDRIESEIDRLTRELAEAKARAVISGGSEDGWKNASLAWEVCSSIHREYAKGKDPFFKTRQSDFTKRAKNARAMLSARPDPKESSDVE